MEPTKLIIRADRSRCFTRVPNAILDDVKSFEAQPAAMLLLLRLYRTNDRDFNSKGSIAKLLGMTANKFYQKLKILVELGYAEKEGRNIVLDLVGEPDIVETEYDIDDKPETEILEELKAQPKRKKTDLTEKDRVRLILEAWNTAGDPRYQTLLKLTPWNRIAIEAHGKRMNVDRDDYSWITQVLRGGTKINRFFPSESAGPSWVFGKNADSIPDWKFQQIQDAYDLGREEVQQAEKAANVKKALNTEYSDKEILAWYNSKVDSTDEDQLRTKLVRQEVPVDPDGRLDGDFLQNYEDKAVRDRETLTVYYAADTKQVARCYPHFGIETLRQIKKEFMQ